MVQIAPFLFAVTLLSRFTPSISTSNGLFARQTIDPSDLPSACQSSCQVVNTMTNCNADLTCLCASDIGSELQQCMSCLVSAEPTVQDEAQTAISGWNSACGGNLSLTGGSGTSSSSSASPSSTSTSSDPNSLGTNGAAGFNTGNMAVCILAALFGAFISL